MTVPYREFLDSKRLRAKPCGHEVEEGAISDILFPFQRAITRWSLGVGRSAILANTGLGKTLMQTEWSRHVHSITGDNVLIVAPLGVCGQTVREAEKLGVEIRHCRTGADAGPGISITNYEMLQHFNPDLFGAVVLDESGILKSYMGKTKRMLIDRFRDHQLKLCCSATPAPNDHLELGNHSEFLGIMPSNEMISRWFINNSSEAGNYRLKRHAEDDFWSWVATWAVSINLPSDLGFDDNGFILPPLKMYEHIIDVEIAPPDGMLFRLGDLSATEIHGEMRQTSPHRAKKAAEIIEQESDETWLIWCNTNYEADDLLREIPGAVDIRGSESPARKEEKMLAFSAGEIRRLVTKPTVAGHGMNWQHCARSIHVGLSYSFEQLYQSMRRTWRYGQTRETHCHLICAETEKGVLGTIERKQKEHEKMQEKMVRSMEGEMKRNILHISREENTTERITRKADSGAWEMRLGDCVEITSELEENSIGYGLHSPPFSNLYIYSNALADMGNSSSDEEFFEHYKYLIRELYRITKNGRLHSIHVKDLPLYKGRDGAAGLRDFPGDCRRAYEECGWVLHSKCTIWKCPVTEMTRTKNHGLLWKQLRKDSCASRMGMADYIYTFRAWKGGEFYDPVTHTKETFPLERWQRWASPIWSRPGSEEIEEAESELIPSEVWEDINQFEVLNYRVAKGDKDEKHICPLQLGPIERCVRMWSRPGDLVFSPFAGIGSEGYVSVQLGRRFLGCEIKPEYFDLACKHLDDAEAATRAGTLFGGDYDVR